MELTNLNRTQNSKVALKARQVLIAAHQPPYELRHNQMENIFLSAVDMYGHDFCPESLQVHQLLLSYCMVKNWNILQIITAWFVHSMNEECLDLDKLYVLFDLDQLYVLFDLDKLCVLFDLDKLCVLFDLDKLCVLFDLDKLFVLFDLDKLCVLFDLDKLCVLFEKKSCTEFREPNM